MHTITDCNRGVQVVGSIMELFYRKLPPYDRSTAVLPQDPAHMPRTLRAGSVEHRNFLFVANYYMRGGIDSNTAFKLLSEVYDLHPELFDPHWVVRHVRPWMLQSVLRSVGLNYGKNRVPGFWIENAGRMVRLYEADPGKIFDGISTYDEACKRICNDGKGGGFQGFQKKMASMLTYFLMEAGFVDPFDFPIPVDIHIARITLSNEIVTIHGVKASDNVLKMVRQKEVVLDAIRDFYMWYAASRNVDPLDLCSALWMYSRLRCTYNPEGRWRRVGKKTDTNRRRKIEKVPVDWSLPSTYDTWRVVCASCPVAKTCTRSISAMPYYTHGVITLDHSRLGPPMQLVDQLGYNQLPLSPD